MWIIATFDKFAPSYLALKNRVPEKLVKPMNKIK